jgi:3-oxoacyl-[acyl-carrier protein] reductase
MASSRSHGSSLRRGGWTYEQTEGQSCHSDRCVQGHRQGDRHALAAAGARVAVNYSSDPQGAERVAQSIVDKGGEAIAVGADVSKAADVVRLFKKVDGAFGRLDILVNNGGIFRFGPFADITEESFHAHYNINVLGSILTVQEAIKRFGPDGGSVINLSSIVGSHPVAGALLYASTKGAIETLTKGLALELAPLKIRVNAIAPGHTETEGNVTAGTFDGGAGAVLAEKTPLGRLGRVTDIAPLAVFLASGRISLDHRRGHPRRGRSRGSEVRTAPIEASARMEQ